MRFPRASDLLDSLRLPIIASILPFVLASSTIVLAQETTGAVEGTVTSPDGKPLAVDEGPVVESTPETRAFTSAIGGYEVTIPAAWHIKETQGDGWYHGALRREPLEDGEGSQAYGVALIRLKNYGKLPPGRFPLHLDFKSEDPPQMVLEYANRLAANLLGPGPAGKGQVLYDPASQGPGPYYPMITVNDGSGNCASVFLMVAVHKKQWFEAAWKVPCSEQVEKASEIAEMSKALRINWDWQGR